MKKSTNSDKKAFSITTDDGDEFPLKEQFASQWIDTPDTTYRCILYYNKVKAADGSRTLHVFLNHDQGKVPEYYSTQVYMSVQTSTLGADSVSFKINTYSGIVEKTLSITPY